MNKKSLLGLAILSVSLLVGLLFLWQKSAGSQLSGMHKKQVLEKTLGRPLKTELKQKSTVKKYEGKYFSIQLPPSAVIFDLKADNNSTPANLLDRFSFDLYEPRMVFVAQVLKSDDSVDNLSSVVFRKRSNNYLESKINVSLRSGLVYTKAGEEKTAFFTFDHKAFSFSLTSPSANPEIAQVFDDLIAGLIFF